MTYQGAEPEVQIMMAEQPTIDVQQSGEANVVVETAEEREERLAQQDAEPQPEEEASAQEPATEAQPATDQAAASEPAQAEEPASGGGTMMTVADLMEMEVVTSDGEGIGSPAAFVEVNGEPNLVLSSGGFLGLGAKEVPVPLSRVTMQGEELVVDQMSTDEIEAAEDFEYDGNLELTDDQQVEMGGS